MLDAVSHINLYLSKKDVNLSRVKVLLHIITIFIINCWLSLSVPVAQPMGGGARGAMAPSETRPKNKSINKIHNKSAKRPALEVNNKCF